MLNEATRKLKIKSFRSRIRLKDGARHQAKIASKSSLKVASFVAI